MSCLEGTQSEGLRPGRRTVDNFVTGAFRKDEEVPSAKGNRPVFSLGSEPAITSVDNVEARLPQAATGSCLIGNKIKVSRLTLRCGSE